MILHKLDDKGILLISLKGKVIQKDILEFLNEFQSFDFLPGDMKLLYDLREVDLKMIADQLKDIAELADKVTEKYRSVKTAFVVTQPVITAYSYLFSGMGGRANRERKVFSTNKAAEEWLLDKNE